MSIITAILAFAFDNPLGKFVVGGLGLVAVFSVWLYSHDAKVRADLRASDREMGAKANEKADEHYSAAGKPGAPDRLRKSACRDC